MSRHPAFGAESCLERIRHAAERFNAVGKALAEIGTAFEDTPDLGGESPELQIRKMGEMLPEALVGRALAEEGIALIEQITWEIDIYNRDAEAVRNPEHSRLASGLGSLKNFLESRRSGLEQFRNGMNEIIQTTVDAANLLEDSVEEMRKIINSKTD